MSASVIPRYQPPQKIREESEVAAAYKQWVNFLTMIRRIGTEVSMSITKTMYAK